MKILLVGGTGVLSSAVTADALRHGMEVTMINRGQREIPHGVELLKHDCYKYDEIENDLTGRHFDAVIDFLCYAENQLEASFNLYSRFTDQYIYISSCAVYDTRRIMVMDEGSPKPLPIWNYSVDKWNSECLLTRLAKDSDCAFTIIRPSVTYGDTRIPYGIMPPYGYHWTLCARILAGKPIIRWNGGINRCNMMRVEDFAIGCVGLIGNTKAYGEAFNICGDETPSFNDVLDVVAEVLGRKPIVVDVSSEFYAQETPSRAGEILGGRSIDAVNSNAKIKSVVPGFRQTMSLRQGIEKTINAYKTQNYQHGIDWVFDAETDRIIAKWQSLNKAQDVTNNLCFVDYLGTATRKDKRTYILTRYRENLLVRILIKLKYLLRRYGVWG